MAENINIDFVANRNKSDAQRLTDVEAYLKLLTDRTKFCFANINDEQNGSQTEDFVANALASKAVEEKVDISDLKAHTQNIGNPHSVTAAQIGLGNVDNTSDTDKPVSNAVQTELDKKADSSAVAQHISDKDNPHSVTKEQLGLANVENKSASDILAELEIGGRNLLLSTGNAPIWITSGGMGGVINMVITEELLYSDYAKQVLHDGSVKEITLSFDWSANLTAGVLRAYCVGGVSTELAAVTISAGNQSGRVECVVTVPEEWENSTNSAVQFSVTDFIQSEIKDTTPTITNLKLERGNKATDWTPAPEDKADKTAFDEHATDKNNPHNVTKVQLGLGNVDNIAASEILAQAKSARRNLLLNSTFKLGRNNWTFVGQSSLTTTFGTDGAYHYGAFCWTAPGGTSARLYSNFYTGLGHVKDKTYALSFYARADSDCTLYIGEHGAMSAFALTDEWQRYEVVYTSSLGRAMSIYVDAANTVYYLSQLMLIEADEPTDWLTAPEDTDDRVTSLEERVTALEAALLATGGEV